MSINGALPLAEGPSDDPEAGRRIGPSACRVGPPGDGGEGLIVDFGQATRTGRTREGNEDAVGCWPGQAEILFAVADGLGGYEAGEVASRRALGVLEASMVSAPPNGRASRRLRRAVTEANLVIHGEGSSRMRTTLTASHLEGRTLTTAHVGDCRLLLFRDGILRQLTADHNLAGPMVEWGLISSERRRRHAGRRVLTRCLGMDPFLRIDVVTTPVSPGDVYLQCSDGIALLSEGRIIELLVYHDSATAAELLLEDVIHAGGDDDISVQVVSVLSTPDDPRPGSWLGLSRLAGFFRRGRS